MKHPLLIPGLLYVLGILAAWLLPVPLLPLLAVSLALVLVAVAFARLRPWLLYALVPLTGWANFTLHTTVLSPHDLRRLLGDQFTIVTVRGRLCETPALRVYQQGEKESWRTLAQLEVTGLSTNQQDWQPATGRLAVTAPGMLTNLFAGQTVEVSGVAGPPRGAEAEGTFDYRAYLRQLGIYYSLQTAAEQDWRVLASPDAPPLADRFRAWACRALARGLPCEDESLRLEWALTLGWKTALTEEVSEPFVQAATYVDFSFPQMASWGRESSALVCQVVNRYSRRILEGFQTSADQLSATVD